MNGNNGIDKSGKYDNETPSRSENEKRLLELRRDIDEIDAEIVQLLCERYDTALELAKVKRELGLPLENRQRESEVLSFIRGLQAEEYAYLTEAVFRTVINTSKAIQRQMLNLYFIGMPNCGKTKLAARVGVALHMPSVDTDELVMERMGKSIDRIFDEDGEDAFRAAEHEVLCSLASHGGLIAATGGGIITRESNISILKNSGLVVFLDRDIECLIRAKVKNRPLIRGGAEAVLRLYSERIDAYRAAADLTVDPDSEGAVRTVVRAYRQASGQTRKR